MSVDLTGPIRLKCVCIGAGNVASTLAPALASHIDIVQVLSRNIDHSKALADRLNCRPIANPEDIIDDADFYLLSVSDDALAQLAESLPANRKAIWAHTSGSVPASVLKPLSPKYGVFYPLQTFTRSRKIDLSNVPFFIEGSDSEVSDFLMDLAHKLSDNVRFADSSTRETIHIAGVMSCNFTTALMGITQKILEADGLPLDIIEPLVKETVSKIFETSPERAMTGPARRGDFGVIAKHLERLQSTDKEVYELMTRVIINQFKQ